MLTFSSSSDSDADTFFFEGGGGGARPTESKFVDFLLRPELDISVCKLIVGVVLWGSSSKNVVAGWQGFVKILFFSYDSSFVKESKLL